MYNIINYLKILIRKLLELPSRLYRLGRLLGQLEADSQNAQAVFYLTILQQAWPEGLNEILPKVKIPADALSDLTGWYMRAPQPRALRREINSIIVSMAEGLISVPFQAKIALFEESLRLPCDDASCVYSRYIRFLSQYGGSDEFLGAIGDRFSCQGREIWNDEFAETWVLYLAALIRLGRTTDAEKLLRQIKKSFGIWKLQNSPPAALFARALGFATRATNRAADLMQILRFHEEEASLRTFLQGKTIAVVGSSPLELGMGRGEEIDSHDIVVRFNRIPSGTDYARDFGSKTTILSRNLSPHTVEIPGAVEVILVPDGLERIPVKQDTIKELLYSAKRNQMVCGIPLFDYRSIMCAADIPHLSTGVMVCAYLKNLVPALTTKNLYGFSHFLDNHTCNYGDYGQFHYYSRRCDDIADTTLHIHPLAKEREFLQKLFNENSNI